MPLGEKAIAAVEDHQDFCHRVLLVRSSRTCATIQCRVSRRRTPSTRNRGVSAAQAYTQQLQAQSLLCAMPDRYRPVDSGKCARLFGSAKTSMAARRRSGVLMCSTSSTVEERSSLAKAASTHRGIDAVVFGLTRLAKLRLLMKWHQPSIRDFAKSKPSSSTGGTSRPYRGHRNPMLSPPPGIEAQAGFSSRQLPGDRHAPHWARQRRGEGAKPALSLGADFFGWICRKSGEVAERPL